jgi:hypothetical protein
MKPCIIEDQSWHFDELTRRRGEEGTAHGGGRRRRRE